MIAGSIVLQNCKDKNPAHNCDKTYTLNQNYLNNLLFDYEHTDTLLYKRTIDDKVKDTLVFIKKRKYRDTLLFSNEEVLGEGCVSRDFTRERIGWDYSSQYDTIFFNVQVLASGEGTGYDDFMFKVKRGQFNNYRLGAYIGNYGANYLSSYETSENIFQYVWYGQTQSDYEIDDFGVRDYTRTKQLDWKSYYSIDYGIVEISKTDRTEVWELIP